MVQQHTFPEEKRSEERIEAFKFKSPDRDSLPVWRFDDKGQGVIMSLITDISKKGAAILMLKDVDIPSQFLQMRMLPDRSTDMEEFSVEATIMWHHEDYSRDHKKLGVQFVSLSRQQQRQLSRLLKTIQRHSSHYFRCELRPSD